MREILSDLVAEQQQLDQFLQGISERDWKKPTPAVGWSIQDQVSHLAATESFGAEVLEEGAARFDAEGINELDEWNEKMVALGRGRRYQEVIEWWRFGRADVVDALSRMDATDRVPWVYGDMSAKSFATMRLMETWAHGLDIKAAILGRITPLEEEPDDEEIDDPLADTPRLRHVAWLGHRTLPFAFEQAGEPFPPQGIRVELMGPKYAGWVYGPDDSDQVIRGMAGDWCRVAVRRQDAAETSLTAEGEYAETALRVAKAY